MQVFSVILQTIRMQNEKHAKWYALEYKWWHMWARLATRGPVRRPFRLWQTVVHMTASPHPVLEFINRKLVQQLRSASHFTLGCLAQAACPHVRAQL